MAAFVPYDEQTPLPEPGARESSTLDFKGTMRLGPNGKPNYLRLAKQMAAFAIIGAVEDGVRGVLKEIRGFDDATVAAIRAAYSRAATDFCKPGPVNDSKVLDHVSGKLVAVNVWPFPGQAVGISDNSETWRFPMRLGIDTRNLTPEQLPMLMIAELRRKVWFLRVVEEENAVEFATTKGGAPAHESLLNRSNAFGSRSKTDGSCTWDRVSGHPSASLAAKLLANHFRSRAITLPDRRAFARLRSSCSSSRKARGATASSPSATPARRRANSRHER